MNTLGGVVFDKRHVLISCSVVDRVWFPGAHDVAHAHLVTSRCKQRHKLNFGHRSQGLKFLVNVVQRKLTHLNQQKLAGQRLQNLTTELSPYAATGTGHQDRLAVCASVEQQAIGFDRLTPEQIINVQLSQVTHADPTSSNITQPRQGSDGQLVRAQ